MGFNSGFKGLIWRGNTVACRELLSCYWPAQPGEKMSLTITITAPNIRKRHSRKKKHTNISALSFVDE